MPLNSVLIFCHKTEGHENFMIGSKVTAILMRFGPQYFRISFFTHLQMSKVKYINNKKILQGKVFKEHWSVNLQFWLRND